MVATRFRVSLDVEAVFFSLPTIVLRLDDGPEVQGHPEDRDGQEPQFPHRVWNHEVQSHSEVKHEESDELTEHSMLSGCTLGNYFYTIEVSLGLRGETLTVFRIYALR